ncbi:hypothetical protein, partial [Desulfovermiculus halophilus]|uniref:hypothetical protein n=1 Tax=Desulfovermiculus halophilus TaxID=339722 RepID=UPI00054DE5D9
RRSSLITDKKRLLFLSARIIFISGKNLFFFLLLQIRHQGQMREKGQVGFDNFAFDQVKYL